MKRESNKKLKYLERRVAQISGLASQVKEAASMRKMAQGLTTEAKDHHSANGDHSANDDESEDAICCAVADCGRNMELPFFASEQPGERHHHHTPKTVNNFGIVDAAPLKARCSLHSCLQ